MNKLIQKNSVKNFKRKLRVGGQIPKLQTAWSGWYNTNDAAKEYANSLVEGVRQMKSESDQIRKATTIARERDRTPSPAINNTAKLQAALFRLGAYKGEKNRKGQPLSFNDAVDGNFGDMSKRAVERAKAMGYTVDMQSGTVKKGGHAKISKNSKTQVTTPAVSSKKSNKNQSTSAATQGSNNSSSRSTFWDFLNIFNKPSYVPSSAHNRQAVMEHKVKLGVTDPYFYISPREGKLYRMQGDNVLYETPIATGVNFDSDGTVELPLKNGKPVYDRSLTTSSTPAGVYTLSPRFQKKGAYNNEPIYHLVEAERGNNNTNRFLQVAIHAPATDERQRRLMNGEKRLTYGCIQLPNGEMQCLYDKGLIHRGDSVYIEPTVDGNYLYEDTDGLVKTFFKETPTHVTGDVWGKHFDLNNVRYNTGY